MNLNNSFAFIPFFATAAEAIAILVLLFFVKRKGTARVSFTAFAAVAILLVVGLVGGIMGTSAEGTTLTVIGILLFIAGLVIIPYLAVLCTFEPQKIVKLVSPAENEKIEQANKAYEENLRRSQGILAEEGGTSVDAALMSISRDFAVRASQSFSEEKGLTSLLEYVNKTLKSKTGADGAAILLVDDFEDVIAVKAFEGDFPPPYKLPDDMPHKPVRIATNFKFASFPFHDNVFGEIASSAKPELITDPVNDMRIYQNGPEDFLECGSYIFVPLKTGGSVIGEAALARTKANKPFTEDELELATTLCDFAASSIKTVISVRELVEYNSAAKEGEIATEMQKTLIPAKLPKVKGTEIGVFLNAAEDVCGDYYDVIVSRKDRVSFVMSDIAGKGLNSLVIMIMVRAMIRLVVNSMQDAGTILSWVNRGIANESYSNDHFGSCALVNYDPESQEIQCAAGGNTPVLYIDSATGEAKALTEEAEVIGADKTVEYKNFVQKVKSGDILVLYTDGLVESLNEDGQQYGQEKLISVIKSKASASGKDIATAVKNDAKKFIGTQTQHDDQSLLVIKIQ